jgi:hypothetical protein
LYLWPYCVNGCSVYNFTGTGKIDAKPFKLASFPNNADLVEPGIDRTFTLTTGFDSKSN